MEGGHTFQSRYLFDNYHYLISEAVVQGFVRLFPGSFKLFTENWCTRVYLLAGSLLTGVYYTAPHIHRMRKLLFPAATELARKTEVAMSPDSTSRKTKEDDKGEKNRTERSSYGVSKTGQPMGRFPVAKNYAKYDREFNIFNSPILEIKMAQAVNRKNQEKKISMAVKYDFENLNPSDSFFENLRRREEQNEGESGATPIGTTLETFLCYAGRRGQSELSSGMDAMSNDFAQDAPMLSFAQESRKIQLSPRLDPYAVELCLAHRLKSRVPSTLPPVRDPRLDPSGSTLDAKTPFPSRKAISEGQLQVGDPSPATSMATFLTETGAPVEDASTLLSRKPSLRSRGGLSTAGKSTVSQTSTFCGRGGIANRDRPAESIMQDLVKAKRSVYEMSPVVRALAAPPLEHHRVERTHGNTYSNPQEETVSREFKLLRMKADEYERQHGEEQSDILRSYIEDRSKGNLELLQLKSKEESCLESKNTRQLMCNKILEGYYATRAAPSQFVLQRQQLAGTHFLKGTLLAENASEQASIVERRFRQVERRIEKTRDAKRTNARRVGRANLVSESQTQTLQLSIDRQGALDEPNEATHT
eukprot:NODE_173_length_2921_cov_36.030641_g157_i0.p1 GENE.NODE_173_length_2921_cov_36.030641_g157_i0~~NODE_173_length_2921_cov_36.030641_g157_i0.p1  ORF type:complete len:588 (+),score=120.24 NODE_173_length_2921_cov_36.030641_g157_i0:1001-2764(+)